jgi:hypothetical protein
VKVRVLGCCGRAGVAGFGLVLEWWVWLKWARGALSNSGIFKKIGAVLSFRFGILLLAICLSTFKINVIYYLYFFKYFKVNKNIIEIYENEYIEI